MVLYFVILGTPTFEDILRNDEGNWIYDFFGSRGKTSNLYQNKQLFREVFD